MSFLYRNPIILHIAASLLLWGLLIRTAIGITRWVTYFS